MGEVVPQELHSCTSAILLNDWVKNEAQYKRLFEEPSTRVIVDARINHQKVGEFIRYQEAKFIKEREKEFREKKIEILCNAGVLTPTRHSSQLSNSAFRVQQSQSSHHNLGKSHMQGKQLRVVRFFPKR